MRVIFYGEIQSCCTEFGKDTRNAAEFARGVVVPLCSQHLLALGSAIDQAFIENTIL